MGPSSDVDEEITLKKSVTHDGRNCQVSVKFSWFCLDETLFQILINEPDASVQQNTGIVLYLLVYGEFAVIPKERICLGISIQALQNNTFMIS